MDTLAPAIASGRYAEAFEALSAAIAEGNTAAQLQRGHLYLRLNNRLAALADFKAVADQHPDDERGNAARSALLAVLLPTAPLPMRPSVRRRRRRRAWLASAVTMVLIFGLIWNVLQLVPAARPHLSTQATSWLIR